MRANVWLIDDCHSRWYICDSQSVQSVIYILSFIINIYSASLTHHSLLVTLITAPSCTACIWLRRWHYCSALSPHGHLTRTYNRSRCMPKVPSIKPCNTGAGRPQMVAPCARHRMCGGESGKLSHVHIYSLCLGLSVHRHTLSGSDKKSWIRAVQCLQSKPGLSGDAAPGAQSRYDDFVATVRYKCTIRSSTLLTLQAHQPDPLHTWHRQLPFVAPILPLDIRAGSS